MTRHFTITISMHVDDDVAEANLQSAEAVRDEVISWLEGLKADVHVEVREEAVPS